MAVITINGREFPSPDIGGSLLVATNVNNGKNANGEFVGQKVGRDQHKFDSLQWKFLDAATWAAMLQEFDKFIVTARIPDMVHNRWMTIQMYPGNRTATPVEFDRDGLPTMYRDCKVNIIDCGVVGVMQAASREYKRGMKETLRNRSYIRVTVGVINQQAQANCRVSNSDDYAYFANLTKPMDNYSVSELYATYEQDYTPADGTMLFLPRNRENVAYNAGLVANDFGAPVTLVFPIAYDIRGLTINFGKAYPVDFDIETDSKTLNITDNSLEEYVADEVFFDVTYIRVTPKRMVNGHGRLRIHEITMGIGIYFDNRKVISARQSEHISPISEEIPTIDFNLTVDNRDRTFDVDNDASTVNFLEGGQTVEVMYGYELDDGTVEWIPGTNLLLKEWEADDEKMSLAAMDRFDPMGDTYYRGMYRADGTSLYDLAADVLADAGFEAREYELDSYLKTVTVRNPMPPVTHKEALQLIANAGRCTMSQGRDGMVRVKAAFNAVLSPRMAARSGNAEPYANTQAVLKTASRARYADYGQGSIRADGTAYFLPRSGKYLNTGYVSREMSRADGLFADNPTVEIELEASVKFFGISLEFEGNPPEGMTIHTYKDGELLESYPVESGITAIASIEHEFPEADRYVLEFTRAQPYNRVSLWHVSFGEVTDYTLEYGTDLTKAPKGKQLEKVKEVQVIKTSYQPGTERKELFKDQVVVAGGAYTVYLSNASHGFEASAGTITAYSSYYVTVGLPGIADGTQMGLAITGYEYAQSTSRYAKQVNAAGKIIEWSNPLVDDALASDLADWVGDYYYSSREYELPYRGDPRIDGNDILYLENQYVENLQVRVYEHSLNFNGAQSGTIKARRDMYVARAENRLVRDRLY